MRHPADDMRPLCEFPSGTAVTVAAIDGGACARGRLCAMGLTPGSRVVVNSNGCGACSVRVRDTTVTLGRGLAGKVLARPANGDAPDPAAANPACGRTERF
ncbi:MAG: FeoA family protein [Thermodesulfobacteriota bacterium]